MPGTTPTALLAVANDAGEAARALAAGADLLDLSGCAPDAAAAIREAHPGVVPAGSIGHASTEIGPGAVVDADLLAAASTGQGSPGPDSTGQGSPGPDSPGAGSSGAGSSGAGSSGAGSSGAAVTGGGTAGDAPIAAVIAVAAISTWLGAAAVRTRHVREVRRAIDMTSSIAGTRPPTLTTRGLA